MSEYEYVGSYDWDDEDEAYGEYYQDAHILYPNESSQKMSIPQHAFYSSSGENISSSSHEEIPRVPGSENLESMRQAYQGQNSREKYFNQDLEDEELLTITVEIGNGETENIVIMRDETADEVADRFWAKYDMDEELRGVFREEIQRNIDMARKEVEAVEGFSTAVDQTPKGGWNVTNYPHSNTKSINYSNADIFNSNNRFLHFSEQPYAKTIEPQESSHTYSTPGPILINPQNNECRTIPKINPNKKSKNTHSCASFPLTTIHHPHINPNSLKLANKKRVITGDSIHSRLHKDALQKQKIQKKASQNSYEASSVANNSFVTKKSQREGRSLMVSAKTTRNRTPNNYGEKLYLNGIKKLEEKQRKQHKEKMERELREWENLTFRPEINPISNCFGRIRSKKLEDVLIEKGKKTQDMIEK